EQPVVVERDRCGQTSSLSHPPFGGMSHWPIGHSQSVTGLQGKCALEPADRCRKAEILQQPHEPNHVAAGAAAEAIEEVVGSVAGAANGQVGPALVVVERTAADIRL